MQAKAASARKAFLQLLSSCQPQILSQSTWREIRPLIYSDSRFSSDQLDEAMRESLFEQFTEELRIAETLRLRRGEETFKVNFLHAEGCEGSHLATLMMGWFCISILRSKHVKNGLACHDRHWKSLRGVSSRL